jgi:sirohydrochlorin cobaltochelatase
MPHDATAALLLVGHGSRKAPRAMAATEAHAERLRASGAFAGVEAGFLTGGRPVEDALQRLPARTVFIVPLFMSDGFFVRERIPERLALTGPVTERDGRTLRYLPPPALDDGFGDLLVARCRAVAGALDPAGLAVLVVGHGTVRDPASEALTRRHAARLSGYRSVAPVFLEQPPGFVDALAREAGDLLVAGLFAADGYHADADVRAALGLARDRDQRRDADGRWIGYTGAVGADPGVAEIVLEQVARAARG